MWHDNWTSADTLKNPTISLDDNAIKSANNIDIFIDNEDIFLDASIALSYLLDPISLPIITTAAFARPNVTIINKFKTVVHICIDAAALVLILA